MLELQFVDTWTPSYPGRPRPGVPGCPLVSNNQLIPGLAFAG